MPQQILHKNSINQIFPGTFNTGIAAFFSIREQNNMSFVYGETTQSLNNRREFLGGLGIDYRSLVCAKQVHGAGIKYVSLKDAGRGALTHEDAFDDTDALITDKKDIPLGIFTADCLSIFLFDPLTPAVGLVHAGWRSTVENIAAKALLFMQQKFNTKASSLEVGFGPAIRSCCYEICEDVTKFFGEDVVKRGDRHYLDLSRVNKRQLLGTGVKEEHIYDSGICTFCQKENFFSYRREGKPCGRMMSVIMLRS